MATVQLRFYALLNDLLAPRHRHQTISHSLVQSTTIKDLIEALGVPHPEVGEIWVNGRGVGFDYRVIDGDAIAVYPKATGVPPEVEPHFVVDVNLGKLARYLRLLGFDCHYRTDGADPELAALAADEGRTLLTRDRGLLKRRRVALGLFVRATQPRAQLVEVVQRLDLFPLIRLGQRCGRCNGIVEPVAKTAIAHRLLPGTRRDYQDFWRCGNCQWLYWRGSHYCEMLNLIEGLNPREAPPWSV
ncbi:MAG: Mut7-C RNAse domain-containing protein [Candidatus Competibacterales bacterium]